MRLNFLAALFLALPATAIADHSCLEELPEGTVLKQAHHLPKEWFLIGGKSLIDPALHTALRKQFKSQYVTGFGEGEFGYLCLHDKSAYVQVSTSDFGNGVTYSAVAPKCTKCNTTSVISKQFWSGSGIHIGQSKAQVSTVINFPITSDISTVEFEEEVTNSTGKIWYVETLRLEFSRDKLIRMSIDDYQESINSQ